AAVQSWMTDCVTAGAAEASKIIDAKGIWTFWSPMSRWRGCSVWVPTTASENAIVFEVPSVQFWMPYEACQVNSPVLGMLIEVTLRFPQGAWLPRSPQVIVVPTLA